MTDSASNPNRQRPIRLISSDLDGTLIGNPEAGRRFAQAWLEIPEDDRPLLCYNSGRLIDNMREACPALGLPDPDLWIGGVGTELECDSQPDLTQAFQARFRSGWNRDQVQEVVTRVCPTATPQPDEFQQAFKSSWFLTQATSDDIAALQRALSEAELQTTIVYSSDRDLDVLPRLANKGNAVTYVCQTFGLEHTDVVVAGDTGNDASMFAMHGVRGIVMAEASHELLNAVSGFQYFRAKALVADGVIEGLRHYGLW